MYLKINMFYNNLRKQKAGKTKYLLSEDDKEDITLKVQNFDKGWKFSYSAGTAYLDAKGAAYKALVDLPHDFMISTERTPDSRTEGAGGFFQGGIGTYEKTFSLSEDKKGKQIVLLIEASYGNTEVWINGNLAKLHHYGYTEFYVDLTQWVKYEEENKLKIVVENTALPNSRWYSGSGLYRHVYLLEGETVYLAPWSVFVRTPDIRTVHIHVVLTNAGEDEGHTVEAVVRDAEGKTVARAAQNVVCRTGETACSFELCAENLKVWDLDTPYLYTAEVCVLETGEKKEVAFGVRTIGFTRENGFLLNGRTVKLQGGCIHHDNGIVGSCAYSAMEERKVRLLKESGYNAIRTSHNPVSTALLDACDRLGMLVMDEAFDQWRAKKNYGDYHLYFEKHWQEDLGSMVMRDRNHPSVIMYSIGNEIGERDGSGNGAQISHDLCEYVRSLDDTRAITNGVCAVFLDAGEFGGILANIFGSGEAVDFDSIPDEVKKFISQTDYVTEHWAEITSEFVKDLDVVGYNYLDDRYEKDGKDFPERLIVGTESYPKMMKQVWERTIAHPYVLGDFTWTAFDYLGESGIGHAFYDQKGGLFCDYPWHVGYCGDYDLCGFIRPQGKFRRLLWKKQTAPVITVLRPEHFGKKEVISAWGWADVTESYSWPGYEGKEIRLDIYSDAEEAEIVINGKSIRRIKVPESHIVQTNVIYEPGIIKVINYTNGERGESSFLETAGKAVTLRLTAAQTDADDVRIITVEAVDVKGNRVPYDCSKVVVSNLENAGLIGFGTGDPVTEESFLSDTCTLYEGRALLILKKTETKKESKVIVTGENRLKGELTL